MTAMAETDAVTSKRFEATTDMGEMARDDGGGGGISTDDIAPGAVEVAAAVLIRYALES
jgi:hypothetical protein